MSWHGYFRPKNPQKYIGNSENIVYRSSWELQVMKYLDKTTDIVRWGSEEFNLRYYDPTTSKERRYFPDFFVQIKRPEGGLREMVWEIKPKAQTKEPKLKKRITKKYIIEVTTYATNVAKWEAAKKWCSERGWEFAILTEDDIFGKSY